MSLENLAVDHPYYASESNFYSNEASGVYDTWADFYEVFHDADVDMNLVFRWDIHQREASKKYYMQIIIIAQKKGIYMPIHISHVDERDIEQIEQFLKPHFEKLLDIWQPLSEKFLTERA